MSVCTLTHHTALGGASGAQLVDHAGDVLHSPVHHGLHVVHVEQVEALHATLQAGDLAAGVAQAHRHPVQLHLEEFKKIYIYIIKYDIILI